MAAVAATTDAEPEEAEDEAEDTLELEEMEDTMELEEAAIPAAGGVEMDEVLSVSFDE